MALSRICSGTVPTTAVVEVLEASGLSQQDVLGESDPRAYAEPGFGSIVPRIAEGKRRVARRDRAIGVEAIGRLGPTGLLRPVLRSKASLPQDLCICAARNRLPAPA